MSNQKKPVLRRCVGCGEMKDKKDLIRVVRTQEGEILPDMTGRVNGRGAYVCKTADCLKRAIRQKQLDRQLDVTLPAETVEALTAAMSELGETMNG